MSRVWSNPTWAFFHIFAEKVNNEFYLKNHDICIKIIKEICNILPCPICRIHATNYIKRINIKSCPNKESFKIMLYNFHNTVNVRLRKPKYPYHLLDKYKNLDLFSMLDNMCIKIKSMYREHGMFKMTLNKTDFSMLDNIQKSIYKYKRYFL